MRRQNRTPQWIADGFLELAKDMPLNKITVQKICDHMQINRSTFYYYFDSIQDMIHWIYHQEVNEPVLQAIREHSVYSNQFSITALSGIYKRRSFWKQVLHMKTKEEFTAFMLRDTRENWRSLIDAIFIEKGISKEELSEMRQMEVDYILEYYCSAHYHVTLLWMEQGMKIPSSDLANTVDRIATNGFFGAMDKVIDV